MPENKLSTETGVLILVVTAILCAAVYLYNNDNLLIAIVSVISRYFS